MPTHPVIHNKTWRVYKEPLGKTAFCTERKQVNPFVIFGGLFISQSINPSVPPHFQTQK